MTLLIDCYNVLHEPMPPHMAGLDTRQLCLALVRSRWRNQTVIVVCDGAPHVLGLTESPVDGVELVYAGHGRKADDIIMHRIESDHSPRSLLVVTSDREIQRAARGRRSKTIASKEFVRQLANDLQGRDTPGLSRPGLSRDKIAPQLGPGEVDDWLDAFGIDPDHKP